MELFQGFPQAGKAVFLPQSLGHGVRHDDPGVQGRVDGLLQAFPGDIPAFGVNRRQTEEILGIILVGELGVINDPAAVFVDHPAMEIIGVVRLEHVLQPGLVEEGDLALDRAAVLTLLIHG